jgi:phosphoglycolate phosphatase
MKVLLFDLDGTIINSEEGITKCVQYALDAYGIHEPDRKKLLCFIGPPLDPVFREKYHMTEEEAWEAVQKYRERYDVKGVYECCLYDGVKETIIRLKEKGYVITLASSKPETACSHILEHLGLQPYFDMVVGSTLDGRISTKQQVLEELYRRINAETAESGSIFAGCNSPIEKKDMCLIGDTKYDAMGAKQFGIACIGVTYGFGTKEELLENGAVAVFDRIEEVEAYLETDKRL